MFILIFDRLKIEGVAGGVMGVMGRKPFFSGEEKERIMKFILTSDLTQRVLAERFHCSEGQIRRLKKILKSRQSESIALEATPQTNE